MELTRFYEHVNVDTKQDGVESAVIYAPFDKAKEILERNGYRIISMEEISRLRMQQGENSPISRNGSWTREGIIHLLHRKSRLVKTSPMVYSQQKAARATEAHRNLKEFYPSGEDIERALEDSVEFPSNIKIPTNRFAEEELTAFAFGGEKNAGAYGDFLRQAGVMEILCSSCARERVNSEFWDFSTQVFFRKVKPLIGSLSNERITFDFFSLEKKCSELVGDTGFIKQDELIGSEDKPNQRGIGVIGILPSITGYYSSLDVYGAVRGISGSLPKDTERKKMPKPKIFPPRERISVLNDNYIGR